MRALRGLNATLALILEIALLVAFVAIGLLAPGPTGIRIALAVLSPFVVVGVWAAWVAPRAPRRLPDRSRLLVETGLFAAAVLGLAAVGEVGWAVALAVLAALRLVLGVRVGRI